VVLGRGREVTEPFNPMIMARLTVWESFTYELKIAGLVETANL